MSPEKKLLRRIGAIPADEKLPISRFARELNCSAAVVIGMVEQLALDGHLDRATWRPWVLAAAEIPASMIGADSTETKPGTSVRRGRSDISASELLPEIDAFFRESGMAPTRFSVECLQSRSGLWRMRKAGATVREATASRIRTFIKDHTPEPDLRAGDCAEAERQAKAAASAPPEGEPGAEPCPLSGSPTGADLVSALEAAAKAKGVSLGVLARALAPNNTQTWIDQLRVARHPRDHTIVRVRALLAGQPVPPGRGKMPGVVNITRAERAASGLPPSGRMKRDEVTLERTAEMRAFERHARATTEIARESRRPGESMAEAVERRLAERGIGEVASDRRARELDELASPSSVLRRAQRDWPDQCDKVRAIAAELEVTLAEAWRRVIGAGVDCLTDPEAA